MCSKILSSGVTSQCLLLGLRITLDFPLYLFIQLCNLLKDYGVNCKYLNILFSQDDMQIRVFNYNTLERVHMFEAHSDYIRCIAVHPTQPYILTSSGTLANPWSHDWLHISLSWFTDHRTLKCVYIPVSSNVFLYAHMHECVSVSVQMTCWSSYGTGRRSGRAVRCLRVTLTMSCRLSSTPRTIISLPVLPWTGRSRWEPLAVTAVTSIAANFTRCSTSVLQLRQSL